MSAKGGEDRVARIRVLAESVVGRVGGVPAVRTLAATLQAFDDGGGGLLAGGLAYAALIALLPGMLLVLSIFGLIVTDPAIREQLVTIIGDAVPPLEDLARTALQQVSAGAVPSGIIAVVGLVWAASRFYAALDNAIARIFRGARRRNEVERTVRGLLLTVLLVALPIAMVFAGSVVTWILDRLPDAATPELPGPTAQLAWPLGTFLAFVLTTVLVYRFVPAERVPARAWRRPAIAVGLSMAAFTQLFALFAPLMFRIAALYGAIVTVFALLAWMSIGFNMLLLGAAWTSVRAHGVPDDVTPATEAPEDGAAGVAPARGVAPAPGETPAAAGVPTRVGSGGGERPPTS